MSSEPSVLEKYKTATKRLHAAETELKGAQAEYRKALDALNDEILAPPTPPVMRASEGK